MNHRLGMMPVYVLLMLVFAACAPVTPNLRDDSMMHDREMVAQDPICDAPCWRTITPGQTPWDEAIDYLETLIWSLEENTSGIIAELEVEDSEDTEEITSIATFRPVRSRQVGALCCQLFSRSGEVVDVLIVQVAPSQRLGMTVGAFIEKYGPPAYLVGSVYERDEKQALMNMIYPDIPMVIYAYVDQGAEGELRERNEVIGFMLMTYDEMQTILDNNNLHTYEGSAPFSAYSADENADFELRAGDTVPWSPPQGVLDVLAENNYTHLLSAIERLELSDLLTGSEQYTIFAPSDAAFVSAAKEMGLTLDEFLADKELLANVLAYHLASMNVRAHTLVNLKSVKSVLGANINFNIIDPNPPLAEGETADPDAELLPLDITLNESVKLSPQNYVAANGWVYALDNVLLPPDNAIKPLADLLEELHGDD